MDSEVIRLAIGLNKVRAIVEKQKQRNALRSSETELLSDNQQIDGKESRVYYDLGLDLSLNKFDNHLSDSQRSDNRISAQNSGDFNDLVKTCVKTKFKRKVLITNGFKDIDEDIPQWVSDQRIYGQTKGIETKTIRV
jgi:hypothetical protein